MDLYQNRVFVLVTSIFHLLFCSDLYNSILEDEAPQIPDHKLIVSVPCTLHSHKPPLTGMFLKQLHKAESLHFQI